MFRPLARSWLVSSSASSIGASRSARPCRSSTGAPSTGWPSTTLRKVRLYEGQVCRRNSPETSAGTSRTRLGASGISRGRNVHIVTHTAWASGLPKAVSRAIVPSRPMFSRAVASSANAGSPSNKIDRIRSGATRANAAARIAPVECPPTTAWSGTNGTRRATWVATS